MRSRTRTQAVQRQQLFRAFALSDLLPGIDKHARHQVGHNKERDEQPVAGRHR
jgi:hypothetical protein